MTAPDLDTARPPGPRAGDARPAPPVRALHVYPGNLYGGVEVFLATLARHRHPGLEHEFALCFEGRLADELRGAGATVHDLGGVRFSRPWTVLRARRRLARALASSPPGVVVCHEAWPHVLAAPVVRRAGLPLVHWVHGVAAPGRWYEALARRSPPDLTLVASRYAATTLHHRFPGASHAVLYYPVAPPPGPDPRARAAVRRELGADEGTVVIVQTSRLERYKGQSLLIEALGRLRDRPGWAAWVAGGPQRPDQVAYLDELRAAAGAAGIADRVSFLGERADVPRLLAAADIHCQPNVGPEPFGIAFVEALDAGLPVVSTRMGGAAEILDGGHGLLVPPGDPGALADALAALIADPAGRARLGAGGPARARALCDPDAATARLRDLLAGVARPVPEPGPTESRR